MTLETMEPNPVWVADAYSDTVETLSEHSDELVYKIWGGDWCKDCRSQLPDFGAALDAADVPDENVEQYAVEKEDDGSKVGPKVEEYDIEYIPTVVVERVPPRGTERASSAERSRSRDGDAVSRDDENSPGEFSNHSADHSSGRSPREDGDEPRANDGREIARFVEEEPVAIAIYLADEIEAALA